jgi:uncharacterized damage-inducible protein DinB
MNDPRELQRLVLPPWATNARVTRELVAAIPARLWRTPIPGNSRRTLGSITIHLHNSRCGWVKTLGRPHGVVVPKRVDTRTGTRRELLTALRSSAHAMDQLLRLGCANGGMVPPTAAYHWRNLALDVGHVVTYFVAHEAHHRGQLLLLARQLGAPIPKQSRDRVWWWKPAASRH